MSYNPVFEKALAGLEARVGQEEHRKAKKFTLSDLTIATKERTVVSLTPENLNEPQQDLDTYWTPGEEGLRGMRDVTLKPRQIGSSTYYTARYFLDTINTPNTTTMILAHEKSTSSKLLDMCKRWVKCCHGAPTVGLSNSVEIYWPEIESRIVAGTAGNEEFGRGYTASNFLGTEVGFWSNPDKIMAGVMESVPLSGNVVLESTANGEGNYFHDMVIASEDGESNFKLHFYPWFIMGTYRIPLESGESLIPQASGTYGDEVSLAEQFHLDLEQLNFRRRKIKQMGSDGLNTFKQEYPSTVAEAFIGKGQSLFDPDGLQWLKGLVTPSLRSVSMIPSKFIKLRELREKEYHAISAPVPGESYVVTCDPSEGLDADGNHDYTTYIVCRVSTWEVVCSIGTRRFSPADAGKLLVELAIWYNMAQVCVERNNHGHAVIQAVQDSAYPISHIYHYKDHTMSKKLERPGFLCSLKSKMASEGYLKDLIFERQLTIKDFRVVTQLSMYRKLPNGKTGAPKGKHDDFVSALRMLAYMLLHENPIHRRQKVSTLKIRKIARLGN